MYNNKIYIGVEFQGIIFGRLYIIQLFCTSYYPVRILGRYPFVYRRLPYLRPLLQSWNENANLPKTGVWTYRVRCLTTFLCVYYFGTISAQLVYRPAFSRCKPVLISISAEHVLSYYLAFLQNQVYMNFAEFI